MCLREERLTYEKENEDRAVSRCGANAKPLPVCRNMTLVPPRNIHVTSVTNI